MFAAVDSCTLAGLHVRRVEVQADIANLKSAMSGLTVEQAYLPAVAPGSIEHWLKNAHYPSEEAFLYAIADAMRTEYAAIVEAGLVLQIDDPDLADGWQVHSTFGLQEFRKDAQLRTDVLNHAFAGFKSLADYKKEVTDEDLRQIAQNGRRAADGVFDAIGHVYR